MNCEKCGKPIPEIINYCPTCKINELKEENNVSNINTSNQNIKTESTQPEMLENKQASKFIPVVAILLMIVMIGYFVINQSDISLFNKSAHNNPEINNDDNFNSDNNSEKMINKTIKIQII